MKTIKQISLAVILLITTGIFSCQNPSDATNSYTVTITGAMTRVIGSALDSVVITTSNPFRRDTVNSDGTFSVNFTSTEKNDVTATMQFRRIPLDFYDTTITISYSSTKKSIALNEIVMKAKNSADDSVIVGRPSARAYSIASRSQYQSISILGSGGNENTNITFDVKDSIGNPVDSKNAVWVHFSFINKPDNLTILSADSLKTNESGQVIVQLSSGQKAGIALLQAKSFVKNTKDTTKTDTIKSAIISIPIYGGLPDSAHFSLGSVKFNVPGAVKTNIRTSIGALVGDKYGNPVQPSTPVYFSTTGGIIQPTGYTAGDGTVSVDLISGNPFPFNGGNVIVTAQIGTGNLASTQPQQLQADEARVIIEGPIGKRLGKAKSVSSAPRSRTYTPLSIISKTITVLYSGPTVVYSPDSVFFVEALKDKRISFKVSDPNGNPLSGGTKIKVTGSGLDTTGAVLTGDIEKEIPDTYDRSYTNFDLLISDKRTKNLDKIRSIDLTVEVTSDNGNVKKTFKGTLGSLLSDVGKVNAITLVSPLMDTVVVTGGGIPTTKSVSVKVTDVNGNPSDSVTVNFALTKSVEGGEYLSTLSAVTNANGIASTTFNSGIRSGIVQIVASVKKDTLSISTNPKSIYIRTGSVASLNVINISHPNLSVKGGGGNEVSTIVLEARDSLGNPIDQTNQSTVTFSLIGDTAGAKISPTSIKTDPNNGRVTTSFNSGTKAGIIQIIGTTLSGKVKTPPIQITVTGGLPSQNQFSLIVPKKNFARFTDKSSPVSVIVGDEHGNPVKAGTPIYFTTNGGIIDASATTGSNGQASATLTISNPLPPNGVAKVEARTLGKNNVVVRDTAMLVFSGDPKITELNGPFTNFTIEDGSSKDFQFSVADSNGNPMAQGTLIRVEASGDAAQSIELTGSTNITMPDTRLKGNGFTTFSFTAKDKVPNDSNGVKGLSFTITVSGPNSGTPLVKSFAGQLNGASSGGNEGSVATVALVSKTADTLVVSGAGSPTSDTLVFVVKDLTNAGVKGANVQFSFSKSLNASEYLSPANALSDSTGKVKVVVNSGVKSGLLQVSAKVSAGASVVTSSPVPIYVKTGKVASINLINISNSELAVKGAGGTEIATAIFEARDILGNALDGSNQINITFSVSGDTAGVTITPSSSKTDFQTGRVTTTVSSGTRSGSFQLFASSGAVKTAPVQITISGGLPAQNQFSVIPPKRNFSVLTDKTGTFNVVAGDKYGNPVRVGTAINFNSTGGLIDAVGSTNASGQASATLQIVNPQPPSGRAYVSAKTYGEAGAIIKDSVEVVFSKEAIISDLPTAGANANFEIEDGASRTFLYRVADINGNPLAQGTTISVEATGAAASAIQLSGDINITLQDTRTSGNGTTNFSFTALDTIKGEGQGPKSLGFKISVTGPNTNGGINTALTGTLKGGTGTGNEGSVSSITLFRTTNDTIVVASGGSPTTDTLMFIIKDVNGNRVKGATAQFVIIQGMNASEYLSNATSLSNDTGLVKTVVNSGLKNGLIQVEARVSAGASTIRSTPVTILVKTGPLATVSFVSIDNSEISVRDVGGVDNANIVFEGRDALGNKLDALNRTNVYFQVIDPLGSGASLKPDSAVTDPNTGRFSTTLTSGTKAGVLQVVARNSSGTIKSTPVNITVFGGFAINGRFELRGSLNSYLRKNYSRNTTQIPVLVLAGDKYGNPVKTGTSIYFTSDAGSMTASAQTDNIGSASSTLYVFSNAPTQSYISSKTVGENGSLIKDSVSFIFSDPVVSAQGNPNATISLTNISNDTITVVDGGQTVVNFTVKDSKNNPFAAGNSITVTASGSPSTDIELFGDIAVVTKDTMDNVNGIKYSFTARDRVIGGGASGLFTITITISGETGTASKTFHGYLQGTSGSTVISNVTSVRLTSSSKDTIFVSNGGTPTTDTLIFTVRDQNEDPVSGATVQFSFAEALNASEYLSSSTAVSDVNGQVSVVVNSGVKAGTLKVVARVDVNGQQLTSLPHTILVKTGTLASIALVSVDQNQLSIRGVGGVENATAIFEARDALGNPLDLFNQTRIIFQLFGGSGSESIKPDSGFTDPFTGRISASISSGTSATVLQLVARNSAGTIKSTPVPLTIHGGYPVDSLFLVSGIKKNVSLNSNPITISVQAGDQYGNPVKPGTAVYFTTNAGIITAAGFTNDLGFTSAELRVVNNASLLGTRTVTARTVGKDGASITRTVNFLMTGEPIVNFTNVSNDTITIYDGSVVPVNFTVSDALGNPISGEHLIRVERSGSLASEITIVGDVLTSTPDTDDKINGIKYNMTVSDAISGGGSSGYIPITITVTGQSGTVTRTLIARLLSPQNIIVPPSARVASQIAFLSATASDISVSGVGGLENTLLTYEVRDSLGIPIDRENKVTAEFQVQFFPNTYTNVGTSPIVLPSVDSTDDQGRLRVSVLSGTQAGVLQIVVNITSRGIKSSPVKISVNSGFADQNHFTIAPDKYNFPGLNRAFYNMEVTVQAGDKYSNPVQPNTAVYFNTSNGIITTTASLTTNTGFATNRLYSGNPYPVTGKLASGLTQGFARIYARTLGENSAQVYDSVKILWTGSPIITKTDTTNTYNIPDNGTAGPFTFTVKDELGNPMSEGTVITVTGDGLSVRGHATTRMPDTMVGGTGSTEFTVTVADSNPFDTNADPIPSVLLITVVHPVYGTYTYVLASGSVN